LRTSAGQGNGGTRVATTTEHSYKALNARVILLLIECVSLIAYGKRVVASAREAEMLSGAPRGPLATTHSEKPGQKTWPKKLVASPVRRSVEWPLVHAGVRRVAWTHLEKCSVCLKRLATVHVCALFAGHGVGFISTCSVRRRGSWGCCDFRNRSC